MDGLILPRILKSLHNSIVFKYIPNYIQELDQNLIWVTALVVVKAKSPRKIGYYLKRTIKIQKLNKFSKLNN